MLHVHSINSGRNVITSQVNKWIKTFSNQEVYHCEPIQIGGKRDWGTNTYYGCEHKYLLVDFREQESNQFSPKWEIIDNLKQWEEENGICISEVNRVYRRENLDRWLADFTDIDKRVLGTAPSILPFEVDADRFGRYAIYDALGKLYYVITVTEYTELFGLFDICESYSPNFGREELVELGYLEKADHTSWLGQGGKHVHAVTAYFRRLFQDGNERLLYFSLDTWCGGNHWSAQEHSPKPVYPSTEQVTCKKCLRKLEKLPRVVTELPEELHADFEDVVTDGESLPPDFDIRSLFKKEISFDDF